MLAPSPARSGPWGHSVDIIKNRLEALNRWQREHGDVVRLQLAHIHAHLVSNPADVALVLHDSNRHYNKQTRGNVLLKLVIGNGLLVSEGSFWLRQRRIAQPAFARRRIEGFARTMVTSAEAMATEWEALAKRGDPVDIADEMMRLTLSVVSSTLFSADVSADARRIGESVSFLIADTNRRIDSAITLPLAVPTKNNRAFRAHRRRLDDVVYGIIRARRTGPRRDDLLSMLLEARDEESGEGMNDTQLRDEVMTMFLAGHETTANLLSWTWHLLSQSPTVSRRLHDELDRVLGGRTPEYDDLESLSFTTQVLKEALRLYPPAWLIARNPLEDRVIGGYHIPAGSLVFLAPWVTHRHPSVWRDPEGFDPDRFAPERAREIPKGAYFPFGGGPRICIGNHFAMMEAQLLLATLAQRFQLESVPGLLPEPEPLITLRPKNGMWMRITSRRAALSTSQAAGGHRR